jgi:hypothetical protein
VAVLGLILLAAAGVLTAAVVTSNTVATNVDLWGATLSNVSLGVIFVAGMLTTLVGVAGLVLMAMGVRRTQRLRQERRVLRRENQRLSRRVDTTRPVEERAAARPAPASDGTRRETIFNRLRPTPVGAPERSAERTDEKVEKVEASGPGT